VVAAAVILDPLRVPDGIDDSKRLSPRCRAALFRALLDTSPVSIAIADQARVDLDNVQSASLWAVAEANRLLPIRPDYILVDGPFALDFNIPNTPLVRGDQRSLSIAAASIIAKVSRDRIMTDLSTHFRQYGFDRHKGYGVPYHLQQLILHGPCQIHRYSCAIVLDAALAANVRHSETL
jgi:ribonuclease HII